MKTNSTVSSYDRRWPSGTYCILKKGHCPIGMAHLLQYIIYLWVTICFFKILILDFKRIEQSVCRVASLCLHDLNKLLKQIGL